MDTQVAVCGVTQPEGEAVKGGERGASLGPERVENVRPAGTGDVQE